MQRIFNLIFLSLITGRLFSQACTVTASASQDTIVCGDRILLSAFGQGQGTALLSENFNSGTYGPGWTSTQQAMWNNPCSAGGVDGTTHIWMGNSGPVPRILTTTSFNLSSCVGAGVTICFDMLFAEQGNSAPCEGPDEPQEGVYLQYSTNNGATWTDIHYFDPNGGNDPQLVNWNNWCFAVPAAALTANTKFRWYQDADSGADYDHWGIDNVVIYCNDPTYNIVWTHDGYNLGPVGGTDPTPVAPHVTTSYEVVMSNGTTTCKDTVKIVVRNPVIVVNAGNDTTVCNGQCALLNATAKVIKSPAKIATYGDNTLQSIATAFGSSTTIEVNVTGLNMQQVLANSIVEVCIDNIFFFGAVFFPTPGQVDISDLILTLICPDGTQVILVPANVTNGGSNPLTGGYTNTCFVPAGANIASGTAPYTGSWAPNQSFNNFTGCSANGVWTLQVKMNSAAGFGSGTFSGWHITFNDPEIAYTGNFNWNPTTNMTGSNTLTPTVCPPPNTYTITVSDTANCVTVSDAVTVNTQSCCALTGIVAVTQPNCGASTGTINVTPVPGPGGAYTYLWSDGNTQQNRTGLAAGTYTVTVTSIATPTCTWDTSVTLNSNSSLNVSFSNQVNPSCNASNGSITVTLSGGTAPYSVTVDTGGTPFTVVIPIAGSQNISGLHAGTVSVSVTDASTCTASANATLTAPNAVNISFSNTLNPTCSGNDGSVTVTLSSGTAPYNVTIDTGGTPFTVVIPIAGSQTISGLGPGNISVSVTDNAGCTASANTSLATPNCCAFSLSAVLTQPTCAQSNGSIAVTAASGSGNYSYQWSNAQTGSSITNVGAGTYQLTVTDNGFANCFIDTTFTLNSNSTLNVALTNPINPTCAGSDGSVQVTISGGTAPYTVTVDTGGTPQSFALPIPITNQTVPNVPAGNVLLTVVDAAGCTASATVTLTAPVNCCTFTISAVINQPACAQTNGDITLTAANGSGNYSYVWGGGQTSSSINSLGAGNYLVTITDNTFANCFIDTTFVLSNPNAPVIDSFKILDVSCAGGGSDGSVTVYASSPNGIDVTTGYTWSNTNLDHDDTQAGIVAGLYLFTVTDLVGCSTPGSVTIGVQAGCCFLQNSAAVIPPTCGLNNGTITVNIATAGTPPYSYSIDGVNYQASNIFSGLAPGNYNAITADANLCRDTAAVVVPASVNNLLVSTLPVDITCFGAADGSITTNVVGGTAPYTYLWSNNNVNSSVAALSAGNYSVTVTDQTNCTGSASAAVTEPAPFSISLGNDTSLCETGTVLLDGGTGFAAYIWNTGEFSQTILPTASGVYTVTVTNSSGCTATDDVSVTLIAAPVIDAGEDKIIYEGNSAGIYTLLVSGLQNGTYNWLPDTLLNCNDCANVVSFTHDTITYVVTYTDPYGCSGSDNVQVQVLPVGDIFWPNAFSPTGDGNNDVYLPYSSGVKQIVWRIFNRWGEKVFESNSIFYGWDGTYKGQPLPPGVYVYTAKVTMMNDVTRHFKGSVTLIK